MAFSSAFQSIGFQSGGTQIPIPPSDKGAGRSRRRQRWEVEYDDEIVAFASAESAHAWLSDKLAEEKAEARKEAKKPVKARKPVEKHAKPVILYEGIDVSRWQYYNKPIAKQIENGAYLKQLERWIQARMDDDDDEEAMAVVM
jgi:hypothetical protein